jgi:hypothetical protein
MTQNLLSKVDNAVKAVESFSDVLDKETGALKQANFKEFAALQELKLLMAQAYQDAVLAFEEDLEDLKTLEGPAKDKLRKVYARFNQSADDNEAALLNAKNTSERIVRMIMDAAKRSVADEGPAYGAHGAQTMSDKIPVHFKLNEVL